MKVMIITPGAFPVPPIKGGSVETAVNGLAKELGKVVKTYVISKKTVNLPAIEKNDQRFDIRIPVHSKKQYCKAVVKKIASIQPSIIQVENRPLDALYYRSRFRHIPIILTLHSVTFIESLPKFVAKKALDVVDLIFVNSHFLRNELLRQFPGYESKVKVLYLGIEDDVWIDRFSKKGMHIREQVRKQLHLEDKRVLLFVGRLIPQKGLHLVLQAMPKLIQKDPSVHLLIVGSSHYGRQLATSYIRYILPQIKALGSHVTYLNFLPLPQVAKMYVAADVVVTPSIGKEALCLVNIEANRSGLPVITTSVGGIPEVISHLDNGYVIDPDNWENSFAEAAISLLVNDSLNHTMGKRGQMIVKTKFDWRKNAQVYLQHYRDLLANR